MYKMLPKGLKSAEGPNLVANMVAIFEVSTGQCRKLKIEKRGGVQIIETNIEHNTCEKPTTVIFHNNAQK